MKIAAVIAEYNPFHNGHAYQLRLIREVYGYDHIIVVMSGDFTQRGDVAIADKYTRARMALSGGADLVIELPAYYACASAEYFATGAVSLIDSLGCVDALFFGTEADAIAGTALSSPMRPGLSDGSASSHPDTMDGSSSLCADTAAGTDPGVPHVFLQAAQILNEEPAAYKEALSILLKSGMSFPKARMQALCEALRDRGQLSGSIHASQTANASSGIDTPGKKTDPDSAALFSTPNNILALEYCRALLRLKSTIKPCAIRRVGADYRDTALPGIMPDSQPVCSAQTSPAASGTLTFSSATAIRAYLTDGLTHTQGEVSETLSLYMPQTAAETLTELHQKKQLLTQNDLSDLLLYQLLLRRDHLAEYADCTPDIADRIQGALFSFEKNGYAAFAEALSSKTYPASRINRVLTHILLDMTTERMSAFTAGLPYLSHARILGLNASASGTLLAKVKKCTGIPLIAKPADYRPQGLAAALYDADLTASHIRQSALLSKCGVPLKHDLTCSPVVV